MEMHEQKHQALLRTLAPECAVLLKSDGRFPLKKPCTLALYGNGARNTVKGGTGSGDVYCRENITAEEALERAGFTITTKAWMDAYHQDRVQRHDAFIASILQEAAARGVSPFVVGFGKIEPEYDYEIPLNADGDACIYVLSRTSGEGNDRQVIPGDVLLTKTEIRDILALNHRFERFMLVLNVGGVVDLSPVKQVKNILYLSQLGSVTGNALADLILGKTYPSGKLATTWAAPDAYQTVGQFGDRDDTRYQEGVFVGYRWFDSVHVSPMYSFGFGLSYTQFRTEVPKIVLRDSRIEISVTVQNVGEFPGKEVLQTYVTPPKGHIPKPFQALAAFVKTKELKPGRQERVTMSFDLREMCSYSEERSAYLLEAGEYLIRVGNSSRDTSLAAIICLEKTIVVKQVRTFLPKPDFQDASLLWNIEEKCEDIPVFHVNEVPQCICSYKVTEKTVPCLEKFTNEELANLCIGAYLTGGTGATLGSSAVHVAGAAGETSNHLPGKLPGRLVMADGPAGLRLSRQWVRNPDGTATPAIDRLPGDLWEIIPADMKMTIQAVYEAIPKDKLQEHITTAIPIGTALAQTWNPKVGEACGDVVGAEMELYDVDLWLAPALNIHRNILCGRNFEYFSEDPLISGKMAAAITRGVQKHPGRGVTLKHFAANNQENNRYNNNSVVSERAMREIYLRGFEIAIREASPKALMTSYNLLNGEHTSQMKPLLEDVLRCEFGFQGLVMTDWVTSGHLYDTASKYPAVFAHKIIEAGNELIMPGGQPDFDDLMESLKEGVISRETLLKAASRVYRAIEK